MKLQRAISLGVLLTSLAGCATKAQKAEQMWADTEARASAAGVILKASDVMLAETQPADRDNAALPVKDVLRLMLKPPGDYQYAPFTQAIKAQYKGPDLIIQEALQNAFVDGAPPDYAALSRAVATVKPILDPLQKAVQRPRWYFERDWDQGYALLLPDFARDKQLCRWLSARALVMAHQGNSDDAVHSVDAILRFADHLREEPEMIGVLIALACERLADEAILNIARAKPNDQALLKRLRALVERPRRDIDWRRMWQLSNAAMVTSLDLVTSETGFKQLGLTLDNGPIRTRTEMLTARQALVNLMIEAEEQWKASRNDTLALRAIAEKYERPMREIYQDFHPVFAMLSDGDSHEAGPFELSSHSVDSEEARRRLAWLAVSMAMKGAPYSLPAEASQKEWLDPFSQKPMVFKANGKGFLLYSVGINKKDDGGSMESDDNGSLDLVVGYPARLKKPNP